MEFPLGIVHIPLQHGHIAVIISSSAGSMTNLLDSDVLGIYCLLHLQFSLDLEQRRVSSCSGGMKDV